MTAVLSSIWKLKIWKDPRGQDFLEYALIEKLIDWMLAIGLIVSAALAIGPKW